MPGNFNHVVDKTSRSPEHLILVVGQALEARGFVVDVKPPTAVAIDEQHSHALTVDTDWLDQKADAQWLADLLGRDHAELSITAVLYLERNGRVMLMDFPTSVTGFHNTELLK